MRHDSATTLSAHGFECLSDACEQEVSRGPSRSKHQTLSFVDRQFFTLPTFHQAEAYSRSPFILLGHLRTRLNRRHPKNMTKPNKRQAKEDPKIKCEYSGCVATFGRNSERRRHVKEKHGPLIYCCVPGCKWTTRRMGRFRTHLDNAHGSEGISKHVSDMAFWSFSLTQFTESTNRILPSEFRTATAQSLASSSKHCECPHPRPLL